MIDEICEVISGTMDPGTLQHLLGLGFCCLPDPCPRLPEGTAQSRSKADFLIISVIMDNEPAVFGCLQEGTTFWASGDIFFFRNACVSSSPASQNRSSTFLVT